MQESTFPSLALSTLWREAPLLSLLIPACPAATKESQFFSSYVNTLCKAHPILDKKDCDPHLINMQHNVTGLSYPCLPNSEYMEVPLESGLNQEALFPQM